MFGEKNTTKTLHIRRRKQEVTPPSTPKKLKGDLENVFWKCIFKIYRKKEKDIQINLKYGACRSILNLGDKMLDICHQLEQAHKN